jgi:hypothetical protein
MLAAVPPRARRCRFVRGVFAGAADRERGLVGVLWGRPRAKGRPSPPGSDLAVAAVRSLDPHQVKFVEACRRGHAATGDPAFAAAAKTVTGLHT